jgi:rubrerythrin
VAVPFFANGVSRFLTLTHFFMAREVSMEQEKALRVMWEGIINERDGFRFYTEAARRTNHRRGKEMYAGLAGDEKQHLRLFLAEYLALSEGRPWLDPKKAMESDLEFDLDAPDFGLGLTKPEGAA